MFWAICTKWRFFVYGEEVRTHYILRNVFGLLIAIIQIYNKWFEENVEIYFVTFKLSRLCAACLSIYFLNQVFDFPLDITPFPVHLKLIYQYFLIQYLPNSYLFSFRNALLTLSDQIPASFDPTLVELLVVRSYEPAGAERRKLNPKANGYDDSFTARWDRSVVYKTTCSASFFLVKFVFEHVIRESKVLVIYLVDNIRLTFLSKLLMLTRPSMLR